MSNISNDLANDKMSDLLSEYEDVLQSMILVRMKYYDESEDTATRKVKQALFEMDFNQARNLLR
jgi:hypothetical protein